MTSAQNTKIGPVTVPVDVTVTLAQEITEPFRDPDFYDEGMFATVTGPLGTVEVHRDGASYLNGPGETFYRTPDEFRVGFPTGTLPSNDEDGGYSWTNNGWFDAYTDPNGPLGVHSDYGHLDDVSYDIYEALDAAIRFVTVPAALGQPGGSYSEGDALAQKILRDSFPNEG